MLAHSSVRHWTIIVAQTVAPASLGPAPPLEACGSLAGSSINCLPHCSRSLPSLSLSFSFSFSLLLGSLAKLVALSLSLVPEAPNGFVREHLSQQQQQQRWERAPDERARAWITYGHTRAANDGADFAFERPTSWPEDLTTANSFITLGRLC